MKMDNEELLILVSAAAKGLDTIKKGAVGYNGYGFVFRDPSIMSVPYAKIGGSKFCTLSSHREIGKKWDAKSLRDELRHDIYLAGCLKTLVPTLKFGGDELLFTCWLFVCTPEGMKFPSIFYYGQSGMSLRGWGVNEDYSYKEHFSEEFNKMVNFNPFHFSKEELNLLVEALEKALKKAPASDFYGVYRHDLGQTLMGVKYKTPFFRELHRPMNDKEAKNIYDHVVAI